MSAVRHVDHADVDLKNWLLPEHALPFAPSRRPFGDYSTESLAAAIDWTRRCPEKRGLVSNAVRQFGGLLSRVARHGLTIEAHIDGRGITQDLDRRLLMLGFEPDGFVKYVPETYDFHRTLEFEVPLTDRVRAHQLRQVAVQSCEKAFNLLDGSIEGYIELEIYPSTSRTAWAESALAKEADYDLSIENEAIAWFGSKERQPPGNASKLFKRADIHIKLARSTAPGRRLRFIHRLALLGFHHVVTWAGNDICTGEFAYGTDAQRLYRTLIPFFNKHGGAVDVTFERVAKVWRMAYPSSKGLQLSRLPPIITAVG